jgi:hypothetical protein
MIASGSAILYSSKDMLLFSFNQHNSPAFELERGA